MKCSQEYCEFGARWSLSDGGEAVMACGNHLAWGCRMLTMPGLKVSVMQLGEGEVDARTTGVVSQAG